MRLGQAVGADLRSAEHLRKPPLLLLRSTEGGEREAAQRMDRDADGHRGPHRRDLLHGLQVQLGRHPRTAELLGIDHAEHTDLTERPERVLRELARLLDLRDLRSQPGGDHVPYRPDHCEVFLVVQDPSCRHRHSPCPVGAACHPGYGRDVPRFR